MNAWLAVCAALLAGSLLYGSAEGQAFVDRDFIVGVKILDGYFGTISEKIEVNPGDENVPFTVVLANVGSEDITGIKGRLGLPLGFTATDGSGTKIEADSESNARAGDLFHLTFFVSLNEDIELKQYPGSIDLEYSRILESGKRLAAFDFNFRVTGSGIVNVQAQEPFLTSLRINNVTIQITNDGTAPISGTEIQMLNAQTAMTQSASSTNVERVLITDTHWDVGHIEPGSSQTVQGTVYIPDSVKSETLRLPLEITYYNAQGDLQTLSRIVDYYVRGLIDVQIYDVGVLDFSGGYTIIGEIINEGNEDALFGFVTVKPLGDSRIMEATQFIDEIEIDSPVPFNVPMEFDGEPQYGDHDIKVTVRYKDSVREEHFVTADATITIPEPVVEEEYEFDMSQLVAVPVVAAVAIGIAAYAVKRRRSSDSE